MSYEENGYLSEEQPSIKKIILEKNKELFDLSLKVNEASHRIKNMATVYPNDLRGIVCSCLLIRIIDSYQSIYFLCELGLTVDASVILRMLLESLFIIKYVAANRENLDKYIKSDLLIRLKLWNTIRKDNLGIFSEIHNSVKSEVLDEIEEIVKIEGIKERKIKDLAYMMWGWHKYMKLFTEIFAMKHIYLLEH